MPSSRLRRSSISGGVLIRIATGLALLALAACAPLPESEERRLTSQGVRPGATAETVEEVTLPVGRLFRYTIETPLRRQPTEMAVILRRTAEGGFLREGTVRIPETSVTEARLIATMVRQNDGSKAEVVGTDVILRGLDQVDRRGRTQVSDRGGVRVSFAPHDCHATRGTCRFTRTGQDGREEHLVVETSELGGLWREQTRRDPQRNPGGRGALVGESIYSVDENAVLIDMNRIDHERVLGKYQEIRRVE